MHPTSDDCDFHIIIPYRNRLAHLMHLVPHLENILQPYRFRFMVIEQADERAFNRGALLNVGFSLIEHCGSCVCFHDVDLVPIDDSKLYQPAPQTTHLAGCVEQFNFALPYPEYMGGVLMSTASEFRQVNGFSNEYWGWGGEDDELFARFQLASLPITRRAGRFLSLPHERAAHSLENNVRLMRTLAAVGQLPLAPDERNRLATIQKKYLDMFGVQETVTQDFRDDGLSTLSYRRIERVPLSRAYAFDCSLASSHELVRVWF
jgi:N-terminal domain of galactosyltransferase/N-terminal region of glycosyl transferase group 7